jgi:hydroxymethylglutaryl-CoA lyase
MVLYGSDGMTRANAQISREQAETATAEILQQARADGVRVTSAIAVAFKCPYDGPVATLVDEHGADRLCFHFHDTRALGVANVFAALECGIRKFDTSIAGLGGCPFAPGASGNVATEDVVLILERTGYDTGIDLDGLMRASELAQDLTKTQ